MGGEKQSTLWVLATPIGNLEDISARGVRILRSCDLIAAEDTRVARRLLHALGIEKKELISYYDQVEQQRAAQIVARMEREGLEVVLISDAGTPCISDPGYRLVAAAHQAGIKVSPVPGPSALTALASVSGLPTNRILFVGFLPTKTGSRQAEIKSWRATGAAVIFFEAMRRLPRTLAEIAAAYPQAVVAIGRELTKVFEEVDLLPVAEAQVWAEHPDSQRGEGVIMIDLSQCVSSEPEQPGFSEQQLYEDARQAFAKGATLRDLLRQFRDHGFSRAELYDILLRAKGQEQDRD